MLSTAIYNILRADANVLATFATKITPITFPQELTIPAITYRVDSITPTHTMGQADQWDEVNISLTVIADTYTLCETYAGYIRTAFTRYKGSTGGVNVRDTNFVSMSDNEIVNIGTSEATTTGLGIFSKSIQVQLFTTA